MKHHQTDGKGVVLAGLDVVACSAGKIEQGQAAFLAEWQGKTWHFSNADHRQRFLTNPDRHAPQFGGYCALAAQFGKKVHCDPGVFLTHNEKLYFFASPMVRKFWNWFGNVQKTERNWAKLTGEASG